MNTTPKSLRDQLGWSQDKMAQYLGVDRSTVSRIESGKPISGPIRKLLDSLEAQVAAQKSGSAA